MKATKGHETARRRFGRSALAFVLGVLLLVVGVCTPAAHAEEGAPSSMEDNGASSSGGSAFAIVLPNRKDVNIWGAIEKAATNTDGAIYQLTQDITADSACAVTGNLTIDLNGHTIKSSGIGYGSTASNGIAGYVMAVVDGSLTIMDSQGSGKFTVSDSDPFGLVYVKNGTLTLNGGTFENSKGFHAFRVVEDGTLIMTGGTIQQSGKEDNDHGGGISVANGGNLTINGGTITGNKAHTGAGIQFEGSGNFTMTGGTITGNAAGNNGGGLYFSGCTGSISFTGGTISNNKVGSGSHGGGIWFGNCANITIGGTTEITNNTACAGGGFRVESSTMTINGEAKITNNTATFTETTGNKYSGSQGIGGGIAAYQSQITIDGGTIKGNKANYGGGGIALRQGTGNYENNNVRLVSGSISDNEVNGGEWQYGGGIYLQDHTSFTMTGGTVSGNHGKGQGGGIATDYSGVNGECTGDMRVTINGGTISDNWSDLHEGGGIGMGSGTLVIEATSSPVYITGNESKTTEHWGGGGIMISDKSNAVIIDALIEGNSAGGFGGGLGACSTGHVYYGVGMDEDNPSDLAAIFGNTAQGKNLSGTASKKNADHTAYGNSVFMNSGYQDVYSALEAVISGAMLGGGDEAWTGSADGAPVTVGKDGFASASQMLGLTSNASAEDRANARAAAHVFITGNHSNTHGGGIMCNGSLAMGWNTKMDVTPGLAIKGTKQYEVKGEKATSVPEFQFAISNGEPTWVSDTEEASGHWKAKEGIGVFTTKNSVDGNFAFDLTFEQTPGLKKETGEQFFYFWEVNEHTPGMTYDPALYKVTVTVSEKTETKTVAGAALSINTWSIDSSEAKVGKWNPETSAYTEVGFKQETEKNTNSTEPMHWTTRTVITLTENAFKNTYNGDSQLSIKKVNEDGEPLQGATFQIYKKDDNKGDVVEGWDGKWTTSLDDQGKIDSKPTTAAEGIIYQEKDSSDWKHKLGEGIYRLVEIEAPQGYARIPGYIEFEIRGTEAGRRIFCSFNVQYSEYVSVVDNGLTLQIKNTQPKSTLRIIKVDMGSTERGLPGAEFELYATKQGEENERVKDEKIWTAKSDKDGQLLWTKVDSTEVVESKDLTLPAGTYYLYEIKAPDGFVKLETPITVTVTDDETVTVYSEGKELSKKDGEPVLTFLLPNTSGYQLPESGGPGTLGVMLAGLLLALGSAGVLYKRLRRAR